MRNKVKKEYELTENDLKDINEKIDKYEKEITNEVIETSGKTKKELKDLMYKALLVLYKNKKRDIDNLIFDYSYLKKAIQHINFEDHFFKDMCIKHLAFLVIFATNVNISKTCKIMRVNRRNFYNWREDNKLFDNYFIDLKEEIIDEVEENFLKNCKTNIIGQMFFLKTQAKNRGYVEKTEIEQNIKVEDFEFEEI